MSLWAAEDLAIRQAQAYAVDLLLERLRGSLAILGDPRRPTGAAALVDAQQGLFLAHRDAVQGDTVQARIGEDLFRLRVLSRDARTNLVLLSQRAEPARLYGPAIAVAETDLPVGTRIVVVLASGGLTGSFVGGQRFSFVGDRKQAVPVSELRFENPPQLVGGALVLSYDGKLVGTMGATVARPGNIAPVALPTLKDVKAAVGRGKIPGFAGFAQGSQLGPAGLVVAYSPTLSVVRRAVTGFVSEDRRAEYAALGIQVDDAPGGGARVRQVIAGTPAGKGGLRVGDVLLAMGDRSILKQYDFVQALLAFRPGEKTTLRLRRDGAETQIEVMLARSKA